MDRVKNIVIVVLVILVLVLSFFLCVSFHKNNPEEPKTVKTDTLYIFDTIEIKVPKDSIVYVDRKITDTLYLPTPQDTTPIPIEQKHYKDTLTDIWISGYKPTIDSIHYHIPQNTMYVEKTIEIEKPKKWYEDRFCFTFGVYGGYSPIYNNFDVIVGGGLSVRIGK
jgi:hypothetical protein